MAVRTVIRQDDLKNKLIQDLGMLQIEGIKRKARMVEIECATCSIPMIRQFSNVRNKTANCPTCTAKARSLRLRRPLDQSKFKMKIIDDTIANHSGHRAALFECNTCQTHFECVANATWSTTRTECNTCKDKTQGLYKEPIYAVWNGIKQRCYSPARKDYHRYGALGVTMCDEWKNSVVAFSTWCKANGWDSSLHIDKDIKCRKLGISPAIYSPETVTFVSPSENAIEANGKQVNQYTLEGVFLRTFKSPRQAADAVGLKSYSAISSACRGNSKTSAGFTWRYTEETK